jgi:hypothetical protein
MQQLTLARQAEFQRYTKKTRREQFLDEMEAVLPCTGGFGSSFRDDHDRDFGSRRQSFARGKQCNCWPSETH